MSATPDIRDAIKRTNLRLCNILVMDDLPTRREVEALFEISSYLEPIWRTGGLNFLAGKVLATLFFETSTRTRLGFEISMDKLGGKVIAEAAPMLTSRVAVGESLADMLQTISSYADLIALRCPNADAAIEAVREGAKVPVISGGFGPHEHPVAGYTDLYTLWRQFGKIDDLKVLFLGPDQTHSRTTHSLAYGLSKFGAEIVFATESEKRNPEEVLQKLRQNNVRFSEHLDPSKAEVEKLIRSVDVVYCSMFIRGIPEKEPERSDWFKMASKYYIELDHLEKTKKELGKSIKIMHPLPRYPEKEMDHRIDGTEYALYWKQVALAQRIRMAMMLSILYGT